MFGLYRTVLAIMVMAHHLVDMQPIGSYAVFGFYVLSGYLMTLIMHASYGYHGHGRFNFAINRALRLFPIYWVACIFTLVLLYFYSGLPNEFNHAMYLPHDAKDILRNIFMIFPAWHPIDVTPRLVPPTWALTVEMFFYFLICIGLSKNICITSVWFVFSLLYVPLTFFLELPHGDRYFPVAAASLPFSIGSLFYFLKTNEKITQWFSRAPLNANALFLAILVNAAVWLCLQKAGYSGAWLETGFYLNLIICSLFVLSILAGGRIALLNKQWDRFIGDLSYPIYLLHWQVGFVAVMVLFGVPVHDFSLQSLFGFVVALVAVILLSTLLIYVIDHPVQRLRQKIRSDATQ